MRLSIFLLLACAMVLGVLSGTPAEARGLSVGAVLYTLSYKAMGFPLAILIKCRVSLPFFVLGKKEINSMQEMQRNLSSDYEFRLLWVQIPE